MSDAIKHLEKHDPAQSEMMEEMCLLVDKEDNVIGTMSKLDCHFGAVSYTHLTQPTICSV